MIIITGAEQGLGKALAASCPGTVFNIPGSVIRAGNRAIEQEIAEIVHDAGEPIEGLINNFGINHLSWIGDTPEEDEDILRCNVMGPYWIINSLRAYDVREVKCINIASATYRVAQRCSSLYCASKAALVQMTKVMARELAEYGWQINAIAPGMIHDTKMSKMVMDQVVDLREWTREEADKYASSLIPAGRYTSTAEVCDAVWRLYGMPSYVNGSVLDMMGGV